MGGGLALVEREGGGEREKIKSYDGGRDGNCVSLPRKTEKGPSARALVIYAFCKPEGSFVTVFGRGLPFSFPFLAHVRVRPVFNSLMPHGDPPRFLFSKSSSLIIGTRVCVVCATKKKKKGTKKPL